MMRPLSAQIFWKPCTRLMLFAVLLVPVACKAKPSALSGESSGGASAATGAPGTTAASGTQAAAGGQQPNITAPQVVQTGTSKGCKDVQGDAAVDVEFTINADGTTGNIKIVKAPKPELAQCAKEVISTTKFEPARKDGVPTSVNMRVTLNLSDK